MVSPLITLSNIAPTAVRDDATLRITAFTMPWADKMSERLHEPATAQGVDLVKSAHLGPHIRRRDTRAIPIRVQGASSHGRAAGEIPVDLVASSLPVAGALPAELNGTLFSSGIAALAAPCHPTRGSRANLATVSAVTLHHGVAAFRSRWACYPARDELGMVAASARPSPAAAHDADGRAWALTSSLIVHANRLLLLTESQLPVEFDQITLSNRGSYDFNGAIEGSLAPHPKVDPFSGELVFFGFAQRRSSMSELTYGTVAPSGRVTRFESFEVPRGSMIHDFAVTRRHVVFPVLPTAGSVAYQRGMTSGSPDRRCGGYLGLMTREDGAASLRWLRTGNYCISHVLNAWDDCGRIVIDAMQHGVPPIYTDGGCGNVGTEAHLIRLILDPAVEGGLVTCCQLDDTSGEFPCIDNRRAGLRNRFGAFAGRSRPNSPLDSIITLDLARGGDRTVTTLSDMCVVAGPVFVPRSATAAEWDGWLLVIASSPEAGRSTLIVFDTHQGGDGPVATVKLPAYVPAGSHACWVNAVG